MAQFNNRGVSADKIISLEGTVGVVPDTLYTILLACLFMLEEVVAETEHVFVDSGAILNASLVEGHLPC